MNILFSPPVVWTSLVGHLKSLVGLVWCVRRWRRHLAFGWVRAVLRMRVNLQVPIEVRTFPHIIITIHLVSIVFFHLLHDNCWVLRECSLGWAAFSRRGGGGRRGRGRRFFYTHCSSGKWECGLNTVDFFFFILLWYM